MLPSFDDVVEFFSSIGRQPEESTRRLAAIVQSANVGILFVTPDKTIVEWNAGAEKMFGYTAGEAIGQRLSILHPPDRVDEIQRGLEVLDSGRPWAIDTQRRHKDGHLVDVALSGSAVFDWNGRITGYAGLYRDITERRHAEESARRLAAIVEASHDAIVGFDPGLLITSWNGGAVRMFGYSREEAIGRPLWMLHPEARRAELDQALDAFERGLPWSIETQRLRKDGTLVDVLLSGTAIRDGQGKITGFGGIYADISSRKHEEENRILRERDAQREMMAMLSHDLRTPLAAIKGFAETLRTGGLGDARRRLSFVRVIERHADRLAQLVDNMLAQSHFEHGRRTACEPVDARALVSELAAGLEPVVGKRQIKLVLELEPLVVMADADQLARVLQNLVDNAAKFTPPKGVVRIRARREGALGRISVLDSGPGIAPSDLERIFERFQRGQSTRHVKGTGLGLFIARKMVEAAGGRIWAESAPGAGACFHFTLPLAGGAVPALPSG